MNKDIFDGLPADERPVAEKLNSVSENMKVPQAFQWTLESQLMDAYTKKSQPNKGWFSKLIVPAAWTFAAVLGIFLLNWAIRSLIPSEQTQPTAPNTEIPVETFKSKVRQGKICEGPLAVAHGFSIALTNEDKTAFIPFEQEESGSELRSFVWSTDGKQLALLGNTRGSGNIYLADTSNMSLQPVLANSELGYLYDFAWSRDGEKFAIWSIQNNKEIFLVNSNGIGFNEKQLSVQILGKLQFAPDGRNIVFYGADTTSAGLFLLTQEDLEPALVLPFVQSPSGFAFSPDGSLLAYMEYDRDKGEARLSTQKPTKGEYKLIGTLSIPKGSGSSLPETANLSWSQDGTKIVFEFGRYAQDRAIYIANTDGSGMVKVVEAAHAPTISSDGNCLAYISNKQVFLLDLSSSRFEPLLLADLPTPIGAANYLLDKLQWRP